MMTPVFQNLRASCNSFVSLTCSCKENLKLSLTRNHQNLRLSYKPRVDLFGRRLRTDNQEFPESSKHDTDKCSTSSQTVPLAVQDDKRFGSIQVIGYKNLVDSKESSCSEPSSERQISLSCLLRQLRHILASNLQSRGVYCSSEQSNFHNSNFNSSGHLPTYSKNVCERVSVTFSNAWQSNNSICSSVQRQLRFYRGRMRGQQTPSLISLNDNELEKSGFEEDVNNFGQDLQASENDFHSELVPASVDEMTVPELSRHACNLVPYVKRSETLQKLVRLGVNLDLVQRVEGVAKLLLKSQWERDIAPLVHLLNLMGIPAGEMGGMLTRNPLLFTQSLEDLSARFGYFLHKKFSQREAASIVVRAPVTLLMDPLKLDSKLDFLQNAFGLKAHEVKMVVLKYPKLLPWRRDMIANVRFHLKEFLAFSNSQLRELLLKEPKLYLTGTGRLTEAFDYLHTTMGITRQQMMLWPGILQTRPHIVKGRHLFLVSRDRAQYNPCLENFVSLKALGSGSDLEFCRKVAKCDVDQFYAFLKTL